MSRCGAEAVDLELAFSDMPAALQAGRVDAIWVVEPFLSTSLAQGGRLVASNYVDTAPDLTVAVYFTSEQLIKNDPDLVKRFTDAMTESLAYADANPDEARAIISTCVNSEMNPSWQSARNRARVQWSGTSWAHNTRNATSVPHSRSI